jgi:predicted Ser/Thr protein kinase
MHIPTRDEIQHNTIEYLRTAGGTRPDLRVVDLPTGKIVVKDFKKSSPAFGRIIGPILIYRERCALSKLIGVKGVPQLIGRIDRYAFAMEYLPGASLDRKIDKSPNNEFYKDLAGVVDDIHARGVAHCDLYSRGNVIFGDDGQPYIVDFAACVLRGGKLNFFMRALFNQFVRADEKAVLRIKRRLSPNLLTEEERQELDTPLPLDRPARAFSTFFRKTIRLFFVKKQQ